MVRLFTILVRMFLGLCVLLILTAGFLYYLAGRSIPDYGRDFTVDGANGRIEIVRANYAVPHIFSEHENDVYYGLGFVHAQDRMWQMLMLRRSVQGRLSELFGERTVPIDELMRSLDLYTISGRALSFQTPETVEILESYANGVNAYLRAVQSEALGRGTPELFLFDPEIAPWTPVDSIALLKLMALRTSDMAAMEVMQARLSLILPPERLNDLFPEEQGDPVMALPDYASLFDTEFDEEIPTAPSEPYQHALYPIKPVGMAGASNAWAVGMTRRRDRRNRSGHSCHYDRAKCRVLMGGHHLLPRRSGSAHRKAQSGE